MQRSYGAVAANKTCYSKFFQARTSYRSKMHYTSATEVSRAFSTAQTTFSVVLKNNFQRRACLYITISHYKAMPSFLPISWHYHKIHVLIPNQIQVFPSLTDLKERTQNNNTSWETSVFFHLWSRHMLFVIEIFCGGSNQAFLAC